MKNLEHKVQVMNENRGDLPLREHVWLLESFDPQFFRWLFEEDFENDFDISLTNEQRQQYLNWFNTL